MSDITKATFQDNPRCICEHRKSVHEGSVVVGLRQGGSRDACELCACDGFEEAQ